eukprot:EG_transcript_3188
MEPPPGGSLERRRLIITDTLAGLVAGLALHDPATAVLLMDGRDEDVQAAGFWCFPDEEAKYLRQLTSYLGLEVDCPLPSRLPTAGQLWHWRGGLPAVLQALRHSLEGILLQSPNHGAIVCRLSDGSYEVVAADQQIHCHQLAVALNDPTRLIHQPPLSLDLSMHRTTAVQVTSLQYSTRFWEHQCIQEERCEPSDTELLRCTFDVSTGKKSCVAVAHAEAVPAEHIAHCLARAFDTDILPTVITTSSTSFATPFGMNAGKPELIVVDGIIITPMRNLTLEGQVHAGRLMAKHFGGLNHPHEHQSDQGTPAPAPSGGTPATSTSQLTPALPSDRLGIKGFAVPPGLQLPFAAEGVQGREVFPASLAEHIVSCLCEAVVAMNDVPAPGDAETFTMLSQWQQHRGTALFKQVQSLAAELRSCVFSPGPAIPNAAALTEYFQLLREKVQVVCAWFDSVLEVFLMQYASTSTQASGQSGGCVSQGQYDALLDSLVLAEAVDGEQRQEAGKTPGHSQPPPPALERPATPRAEERLLAGADPQTAAEYAWAVQHCLAELRPHPPKDERHQRAKAQLVALQEQLVEVVVRAKRVQVVAGPGDEANDALEELHQPGPRAQHSAADLEYLERLSNYVEMALGNLNPATAGLAKELGKHRDHCDSLEARFFTLIDGKDPTAPLSVQFQKDFVTLRRQATEYRTVLSHQRDQDLTDLRKAWSPLVETYALLIGMLDNLLENMADYERQTGPIEEPDWLSVLWDWKAHFMESLTRRPQVEQQEGGNETL